MPYDITVKKRLLITLSLLCFSLVGTSCFGFWTNKGATERLSIEYTDEAIDKEALDQYFLTHQDLYPSYEKLKENEPNILDNVKALKQSDHFINDFQILRFSVHENGFLDGETFLYKSGICYRFGTAFGGFGVTEFVRRQGDAGHWLFFIDSFGSGIHQTQVGVFDLIQNNFYTIKDLELERYKDYTFVVDEKRNNIDLYESSITPSYSDDGFGTYSINQGDLAFQSIDDMEKLLVPLNS